MQHDPLVCVEDAVKLMLSFMLFRVSLINREEL